MVAPASAGSWLKCRLLGPTSLGSIRGSLGVGEVERVRERNGKRAGGNFEGNRYFHYLNYADGFVGI